MRILFIRSDGSKPNAGLRATLETPVAQIEKKRLSTASNEVGGEGEGRAIVVPQRCSELGAHRRFRGDEQCTSEWSVACHNEAAAAKKIYATAHLLYFFHLMCDGVDSSSCSRFGGCTGRACTGPRTYCRRETWRAKIAHNPLVRVCLLTSAL